jgi:hypothetical protein
MMGKAKISYMIKIINCGFRLCCTCTIAVHIIMIEMILVNHYDKLNYVE